MIIKKDSYINEILKDTHYTPIFNDYEFKTLKLYSIDFAKNIDVFVMAKTTLASIDKVKISEKDLSIFRNLTTSCFIVNKVGDDEYVTHVDIKANNEEETIDFIITGFCQKENWDNFHKVLLSLDISKLAGSELLEKHMTEGIFDNRRFNIKYSLKENKIIDYLSEDMYGNIYNEVEKFLDIDFTNNDLGAYTDEFNDIDIDIKIKQVINTFDYRSIFKTLVYIYFTDKEEIHIDMPPNKKVKKNKLRLKNDTIHNVTYIDSMWNKIIHVNGVKVKGHLALRACGKGRKDRRITWIKPHNKTYTRKKEMI